MACQVTRVPEPPAAAAVPHGPGSIAVTSAVTDASAEQGTPNTESRAALPEDEPVHAAVSESRDDSPSTFDGLETLTLPSLELADAEQVSAPDGAGLEDLLGSVDWTSIAKMNHGTPSMMSLGNSWGMSLSSGMDRLEECEPTLDLVRHGPGFADTFVSLSAHYRLTRSAHLVGRVAGIRAQDEALSDVVDDADVSAFTLGVYMHF